MLPNIIFPAIKQGNRRKTKGYGKELNYKLLRVECRNVEIA